MYINTTLSLLGFTVTLYLKVPLTDIIYHIS